MVIDPEMLDDHNFEAPDLIDTVRAAWARCRELEKDKDEAWAVADARTKQWAQAVAVTDKLRKEYATLKQELADAMHTIHDQAEIIERYEAPR